MTSSQLRETKETDASNSRVNRRRLISGAAAGAAILATGSTSETRLSAQESGPAAVVSSHWLATNAGRDILESGGTAADAAVAVAAVLTVVEPYFSSALGGGTWALYYEADTGEVTSLDGVGPVGSLATLEEYAEIAGERGMHQANVPGAWDGWMLWLERFGVLGLDEILDPAIVLARDGFPIASQMVDYLGNNLDMINSYPDTQALYVVDGELPEFGDDIQLLPLANTFQSLSDAYTETEGDHAAKIEAARDYYYRGPIAEAMVAFSEENGGHYTLDDFASFEAEIVEPVSVNYRGLDVYQNPPNSQGIAMLLALNTLKGFDLSQVQPDSADTIHVQVEAIKLAFADRYFHVGDPGFVDVPVEELLSDQHGRAQLERIDLANAMEWPIESELDRQGSHTTTFHIVDQMGNAAAVTTSIGFQFLVIGDTGIHINHRNGMFSLEEGNPNVFGPGKKIRHTSCPYMVLRDGRPYMVGGNTGADTQPQGQMQQFMNVTDFGFTAQDAVDQPRFVSTAFPSTSFPHGTGNTLQMEEGFPDETIEALEDRGHDIVVGQGIFGSAHLIIIDQDEGTMDVGAESRGDDSLGVVIPGT